VSLTNKTLASSLFILSSKFIQRGLGVVSMLILARILAPEDFGVVSISTMAVFLFITLSDLGAKQYISQLEEVTENAINGAWTLNILIKFSLTGVYLLSVPYIAVFLEKPEVIPPLYALSVVLPLSCCGNPGVWLHSRNLNYKPLFRIEVISKALSFLFIVTYAYFNPSYWAMIFGVILSYALPMLLSYTITKHKPKLCFTEIRGQSGFSQWIILNGFVGFAKAQTDALLVSKFFALELVGVYGMFKNLTIMPANQIFSPLTEPLIAAFSTLKRNGNLTPYHINLSTYVSMLLLVPTCALMRNFHFDIVYVLLGSKWTEHSQVFANLALLMVPLVHGRIVTQLLIAIGYVKNHFYFTAISSFVIVAACFLGIQHYQTLESFALFLVLIVYINQLLLVAIVSIYFFRLALTDLAFSLLPVLYIIPGLFFIEFVNFDEMISIVRLVVACSAFTLIYASVAYISHRILTERAEIATVNRAVSQGFEKVKRLSNTLLKLEKK
tara:strand:- start:1342 stop:2835 length:1494 start_codon:yes stop_codon:yes gene_type:complete